MDKSKFVSDFRNAVSNLLVAIDHTDNMVAIADDLGWTDQTFSGMELGDITPAEFYAALAEWDSISTAFEASITHLTKLKP